MTRWTGPRDARPQGPRFPRALHGIRALRNLPGFYDDAARRYGTRWLLRLPERDWLMSAEPDDARRLLALSPEVARAGEANSSLRPIGGARSVVLLDGAEHLRARRILLPPFRGDRMRAHCAAIEQLTDEMIESWRTPKTVSLYVAARRLTFAVILRRVLGIRDRAAASDIGSHIERLFGGAALVMYLPGLQRDLGPLSPWRRFLALRRQADEAIYRELAAHRMEGNLGERDDVLSLLMCARWDDGRELSDQELRDQLMTLLVAGHETTTAAIAWTMDSLLRHPRELSRLREELRAGGDEYLDAAITEGLRYRPPVPMFGRVLSKRLEIAGHVVPAGVAVGINTWSMHHRPDLFPDPGVFSPARFLEGAPPSHAYMPFGGGTRRCLGAAFAQQELRVVIGQLVGRCDFELADPRPEGYRLRGVTLTPSRGVRVLAKAAPNALPREKQ